MNLLEVDSCVLTIEEVADNNIKNVFLEISERRMKVAKMTLKAL